MNAFTLLKEDHQKVSGIFEKLEGTTERAEKTREELFAQLKQELEIHALVEETIFYPELRREAETREITLEGIEEHKDIKAALAEVGGTDVASELFAIRIKVLKELVEHHVEEEEGEMFKTAREVFPAERIEELGARMEEEKKAQQQKLKAAGA
jgi:hypothetical protein